MLARITCLLADEPAGIDSLLSNPIVRYGAMAAGVFLLLLIVLGLMRKKKAPAEDPEAGMSEDLAAYPPEIKTELRKLVDQRGIVGYLGGLPAMTR